MDFCTLLVDIQYDIIKLLPFELFMGLSNANKYYHTICNDNKLWLQLLKKDYPFYTPTLKSAFIEYAHFYLFFNKQLQILKSHFHVIYDIDLIKKLYVDFTMLSKRYNKITTNSIEYPELTIIYDAMTKSVYQYKTSDKVYISPLIEVPSIPNKAIHRWMVKFFLISMVNKLEMPEEVPDLI